MSRDRCENHRQSRVCWVLVNVGDEVRKVSLRVDPDAAKPPFYSGVLFHRNVQPQMRTVGEMNNTSHVECRNEGNQAATFNIVLSST